MMKLPILPCAEKLELVLSTAPKCGMRRVNVLGRMRLCYLLSVSDLTVKCLDLETSDTSRSYVKVITELTL